MSDAEPLLTSCAKHGVNAFSIGEDPYYPYKTKALLEPVARLDKLAKQNGCTISAGGYNDAFGSHFVSNIAGAVHSIKEIHMRINGNADDFFANSTKDQVADFGVDVTEEVFAEKMKDFNAPDREAGGYCGTMGQWLCDYMGWEIESCIQRNKPVIRDSDITSRVLNSIIPAGKSTGFDEFTETITKNGKKVTMSCAIYVYPPDEKDVFSIEFKGEPSFTVSITPSKNREVTTLNSVNRIPDIIAAPPFCYIQILF